MRKSALEQFEELGNALAGFIEAVAKELHIIDIFKWLEDILRF